MTFHETCDTRQCARVAIHKVKVGFAELRLCSEHEHEFHASGSLDLKDDRVGGWTHVELETVAE